MDNVRYVGLSAQVALRRHLDVVASNVANMNTAGFKGDRMLFAESLQRVGAAAGDRVSFVIDKGTYRDFSAGPLNASGNNLDAAIDGEGFFRIQAPEGQFYTRDGRFSRDPEGRLVTVSGHRVLDDGGGEIVIPQEATNVDIGLDGGVTVDGAFLARIGVVRFDQPQLLEARGDGLYAAAAGQAPVDADNPRVVQGMVEGSNVQSVVEMTRMIEINRAYAQAEQAASQAHELQKDSAARLGRVV